MITGNVVLMVITFLEAALKGSSYCWRVANEVRGVNAKPVSSDLYGAERQVYTSRAWSDIIGIFEIKLAGMIVPSVGTIGLVPVAAVVPLKGPTGVVVVKV